MVADLVATLPEADHARFDAAVWQLSLRLTPPRFRQRARVIREKLLGNSAAERHEAEAAFRRVEFEPALDGMAWIHAYLPATAATLAMTRIDEMVRDDAADDPRTLGQRRADAFARILVPADAQVSVTVGLLVPVLSLLGIDEQPATLEGFGPVDAETARALTAHAPSFLRILTHPITGTVLDIDKTTLRVPADMRRWLELRDGSCTFPGCGRRARSCELDHTTDRQFGGITKVTNLAHLCKKHHREKHHTRWKPEHAPDGSIRWTSPTGHTTSSDPPAF